ncbi:4'-phosphopantetheinyl transferase [Chromobacterium sp. ATCC 53434]|uniref:4'-phosphopantetheinyl transferase family protein n=1 Tax=Chromobacterium sp. (strain ATCC 53434 / SC 14030) TaxID=2059672 RepID=UPI0013050A3C|nr:hypothetical protein [Chromobacterium sp. ATCC 53434]
MLTARVDVGLSVPNLIAAAYDSDRYSPASHASLGVALPPSLSGAVARRKAAYLAGRYCAMQALSQAGHPLPCELPIGEDRSPVWPAGLVGSITHTEGLAAAVVASAGDARGLGIDAERIIGEQTCRLLRDQIVGEREWRFERRWFDLARSLVLHDGFFRQGKRLQVPVPAGRQVFRLS